MSSVQLVNQAVDSEILVTAKHLSARNSKDIFNSCTSAVVDRLVNVAVLQCTDGRSNAVAPVCLTST